MMILEFKSISIFEKIQLFSISCLKGSKCEVDGKFYAQNEYFPSGAGDCALCGCWDSGLSCDITNCQGIESYRTRRNVMHNADLDVIKMKLTEKLIVEEEEEDIESAPEINIIVNRLENKRVIEHSDKSKSKKIYLNANAGVENFTPYVLNITTTPSKFHLTRVSEIIINKTFGISFKPDTEVLGYAIQTDLDSTGIDPIILHEFQPEEIESASQSINVPPHTTLRIKNAFYQYQNEIDYLLDFEIDDESTISFANKTISLKEMALQHIDSLPMGEIGNHLQLDMADGKLVLKNFPAKMRTMDFGIEMVLERLKLDDN